MDTGQADMGNQQTNKGTDRAIREPTREPTGETWQSDRGGDRVRTEGLRQRQGEIGKDPKKLGIKRNGAQTQKNTLLQGFSIILRTKFLFQGSDSEQNVMVKTLFMIQMRYLFSMSFFFDSANCQ